MRIKGPIILWRSLRGESCPKLSFPTVRPTKGVQRIKGRDREPTLQRPSLRRYQFNPSSQIHVRQLSTLRSNFFRKAYRLWLWKPVSTSNVYPLQQFFPSNSKTWVNIIPLYYPYVTYRKEVIPREYQLSRRFRTPPKLKCRQRRNCQSLWSTKWP